MGGNFSGLVRHVIFAASGHVLTEAGGAAQASEAMLACGCSRAGAFGRSAPPAEFLNQHLRAPAGARDDFGVGPAARQRTSEEAAQCA